VLYCAPQPRRVAVLLRVRRYTVAAAGETRITLDDFPNGRALIHIEIPTAVYARMLKMGLTPEYVFNAMIAAAPKVC